MSSSYDGLMKWVGGIESCARLPSWCRLAGSGGQGLTKAGAEERVARMGDICGVLSTARRRAPEVADIPLPGPSCSRARIILGWKASSEIECGWSDTQCQRQPVQPHARRPSVGRRFTRAHAKVTMSRSGRHRGGDSSAGRPLPQQGRNRRSHLCLAVSCYSFPGERSCRSPVLV
jgi:hypothetical protein